TLDGDMLKVSKEVENGVEVIGVKLPCLVTFTKPSFDPRYPTIKSKMAANRAQIATLSEADMPSIDLSKAGLKGSPTKVKKTFVPERKKGGVKIEEESGEAAGKKLFELLSGANIV
ncbi:MAG: electron transfer flavoprotein subunit beta, partial [Clostridiales bacterium]|nr:electron transfer flavoprotein subunit beta [Clostridiales bacterium]